MSGDSDWCDPTRQEDAAICFIQAVAYWYMGDKDVAEDFLLGSLFLAADSVDCGPGSKLAAVYFRLNSEHQRWREVACKATHPETGESCVLHVDHIKHQSAHCTNGNARSWG
jgi:hypothetical protein